MSVVIRTTPEADAQALRVAEWWRTNRPAAADLFVVHAREEDAQDFAIWPKHASAGGSSMLGQPGQEC